MAPFDPASSFASAHDMQVHAPEYVHSGTIFCDGVTVVLAATTTLAAFYQRLLELKVQSVYGHPSA